MFQPPGAAGGEAHPAAGQAPVLPGLARADRLREGRESLRNIVLLRQPGGRAPPAIGRRAVDPPDLPRLDKEICKIKPLSVKLNIVEYDIIL